MSSKVKKKWLLPVILGGATFLLLLTGMILLVTVVRPKQQVKKFLAEGEQYHADADDEKAILSYEAALAINPKSERAYLDLADAYESLYERYMDEKMPDEGIKTYTEGVARIKEGCRVTNCEELRSRLSALIGKETEVYEKADRVRVLIEMEAIASELQPVMDEIAELAYLSKWDEVFEYMNSEEYEAFLKERQKLEDKWVFKTKQGNIGFYKVNDDRYGEYMLYFGYYSADGQREGKGDWFGAYCGNNYHARGEWKDDTPQGYWKIKEWNGDLNMNVNYRSITGNVVDGLLDGEVEWSFYFDNKYNLIMRRCVFDRGKWVITSGPDKDGCYRSAAGQDLGIALSPEEAEQIQGLVGYVN